MRNWENGKMGKGQIWKLANEKSRKELFKEERKSRNKQGKEKKECQFPFYY